MADLWIRLWVAAAVGNVKEERIIDSLERLSAA